MTFSLIVKYVSNFLDTYVDIYIILQYTIHKTHYEFTKHYISNQYYKLNIIAIAGTIHLVIYLVLIYSKVY